DPFRRRDPRQCDGARSLVPQPRPQWCADGARSFPRRLPGGEMVPFRTGDPGRSDRQKRARYRLQCRLLFARNEAARRGAGAAQRRLRDRRQPGGRSLCLPPGPGAERLRRGLPGAVAGTADQARWGGRGMIEAAMIWNEPNNKSHWDPELDPDWSRFARMGRLAGEAIAAEAPGLTRVLGGISPIDPNFVANMIGQGLLQQLDAVAVHGFPLDWNLWPLDSWPQKLDEIAAVTDLPIWVSEVGASRFGAEEVQEFGLRRTAELLIDRAPRIHWYSLYDLPQAWP